MIKLRLRMHVARFAWLSIWLFVLSTPARGLAQAKRPLGKPELSHVSYEWERTARLLATQNLALEPEPEGKRIAFIRIVRDDVFVADEVWPTWLNWFHGRTRESVVRREVLFESGSYFQNARIEETMRNLRGMGIFALVRIVAVKTGKPHEVGVVVHTRDLWSLRLEQDFSITRQLNSLLIRGTELNAFGRNKTVSADITIIPKSYAITQSYYARRVLGSSVAFRQRAGLIFNRATDRVEGNLWSLAFGQPYYLLKQRYSWIGGFSHDTRVARSVRNGQVREFPDLSTDYEGARALRVYRQRSQLGSLVGYLRRGEHYKQTFGLGWDYRKLRARPNDESGLPAELREAFAREILPAQRTESGPSFSYDVFMPIWATFLNLSTYGQSENVRIGPHCLVSTRLPLEAFGSSSNSWVVSTDVGFTLAPRGALIDARVTRSARYEHERLVDQKSTFLLRGASPTFSVFRFVASLYLELRKRDTQKTYVTLGGDTYLRGYDSQALDGIGAHRAVANFELRTLPIEWQAVHLGGVLFYDVGSVYQNMDAFRPYHAIGIGARLLFSQFNRYPFTFDGGFSFDPGFRFVPTLTSGQVVPLTASEDPS